MSCRNTRTEVNPSDCAQPSSRSIVFGSQVSACQNSSWLMAVLGVKLQPTSQGCLAYQALAWSGVQWARGAPGRGAGVQLVSKAKRAVRTMAFTAGLASGSMVSMSGCQHCVGRSQRMAATKRDSSKPILAISSRRVSVELDWLVDYPAIYYAAYSIAMRARHTRP